jgi:hypothetical protein
MLRLLSVSMLAMLAIPLAAKADSMDSTMAKVTAGIFPPGGKRCDVVMSEVPGKKLHISVWVDPSKTQVTTVGQWIRSDGSTDGSPFVKTSQISLPAGSEFTALPTSLPIGLPVFASFSKDGAPQTLSLKAMSRQC